MEETDYKAGDIVIHENKYYKAEKDIPKAARAEPDRTPMRFALETAHGIRSRQDHGGFAQALYGNDALLRRSGEGTALDLWARVCRAQCVGRELNQAEANNIYKVHARQPEECCSAYGAKYRT